MGNANAAQEPSMEEILASIRQIISEEGAADIGEAANQRGDRSPSVSGASMGHDNRPPTRVAEGPEHDIVSTQGGVMKPNGKGTARSAERGASAAAALHETGPTHAANEVGDARLLSDGVDEAVSTSFSALAHTILAQNARTLEDLVAEMLQPMLRDWLDDNLPTLVERIVQEEIQRVSRGRR